MRERRRGEQKRSLRHFFSLSHRPPPSVRVKGPESLGVSGPSSPPSLRQPNQGRIRFSGATRGRPVSPDRGGRSASRRIVLSGPRLGSGPRGVGTGTTNPNFWRHSELVSGHALAHGGDGSGGSRDLLASVLASRSPRQHSARSDRLRQLLGVGTSRVDFVRSYDRPIARSG